MIAPRARHGALALVAASSLAFLAIPLVALFTQAPLGDLPSLLREPVVQDAIWVTLKTNLAANPLVLGLGTPAAWFLATRRFPGRALVLTLVELPLVLPPAVAGIALLAAFAPGRPVRRRARATRASSCRSPSGRSSWRSRSSPRRSTCARRSRRSRRSTAT